MFGRFRCEDRVSPMCTGRTHRELNRPELGTVQRVCHSDTGGLRMV